MARIRSIKPDLWTDEKIVELEYEWRLLFIGLWNFADDEGYIGASPKRIKMQIFPADSIEVSRGLARLHDSGLVEAYTSELGSCIRITHWERHQRVSNPAKSAWGASDLRKCESLSEILASPRDSSRVIGKGREGKGREVKDTPSASPRASVDDFETWWLLAPRKIGKGDARKAFATALGKTDAASLIAGMGRYVEHCRRERTQARYIVHPATWLRQERWNDEHGAGFGNGTKADDRDAASMDLIARLEAQAAEEEIVIGEIES